MSACISRHGEYSDHVGNALYCERCGALNERRLEALEAVVDKAREWRRVEDSVATSDEYRGSEKAIVAGNRIMADAKSALLVALAALDGGEAE